MGSGRVYLRSAPAAIPRIQRTQIKSPQYAPKATSPALGFSLIILTEKYVLGEMLSISRQYVMTSTL